MSATEREVDRYTNGECHVFAVAMHRLTDCGFLVVTDPTQPSWVDEEDPDNQIDGVVHVFALVGDMAVDVEGTRPADEVEAYCEERFGSFMPTSETVETEEQLWTWVQGRSPDDEELDIERPLSAYDESDVEEASHLVGRLGHLSVLPGRR
jgi:hypothetical protein